MTIPKYTFSNLVDIPQLKNIFENFSAATSFTTGVVDQVTNEVLIGTGWRDICTKFHRRCTASDLHCQSSNRELTENLCTPGEIRISHCKNGLVDGCTPIIVDGHHLANLFTGQVMFVPPDRHYFQKQSHRFGYDEELYMAALESVPVVSEEQLKKTLLHLAGIASMIAEAGLSRHREEIIKEKYQVIFNAPSEAVIVHGVKSGNILDVNDGMLEMFGCSREKALKSSAGTLSSGIFPYTISEAEKKVAAAVNVGPQRFDWQSKRINGELFWVEVSLKLVEFGSEPYVIATVRDITERKLAEEENYRAKRDWELTFDAVPDMICILNEDHTISRINQTMADFIGMTKDEAIGKPCHQVVHASSCPPEGCPHKRLIKDEQPHVAELYEERLDTYLHVSVTPLIDKNSNHGYVHVARDISVQKKAVLALNAEKERLAVTLRSIGDGVIITDIEGNVVGLNRVAEKLTGWSEADALGKSSLEIFNIINEKSGVRSVSPVQQVLEQGRIVGLASHTALIARDGSRYSIADSGAPIRDSKSMIVGVVIVFRDVTHEKRIEEELSKIRKLEAVGVLAGGIAHDFNNILSAILGNIELAGRLIQNNDPQAALLLAEAQRAARRASKLTGQLLTFAKGGDPVKETASICEIVKESSDFILRGTQISCEQKCPTGETWLVDVDSGQISQVIQNIILNAKHAMPQGGRIIIRCNNVTDAAAETLLSVNEGNFVRITIQDSGVGIPEQILDKIFDPYFTTKQEGSGLGLAICYSIINKHDGYLTAESETGKGATFTIYLPASENLKINKNIVITEKAVTKASRIIVMDDDKMIRDLAKSQLNILGHEAVLVADGEQAINRYRELQDRGIPADLVIMDLTIPGGMGGREAAEKLLKLDPKARLIVASGYSNDPIMANCQEYGFRAAVVKPFDLAGLSNAITTAIK